LSAYVHTSDEAVAPPRRLKGRSLDSLQILRAFAASIVVMFHAAIIFGTALYFPTGDALALGFYHFFAFGHAGVDLFFVLSGFIIAHAHWNDDRSLAGFWHYVERRLTRIYPTTLLVVGFILLFAPLLRWLAGDADFIQLEFWRVVASLTLLPVSCEHIPGALWSLTNEMYFYTVFALFFIDKRLFLAALVLWTALVLGNMALGFAPQLAVCGVSPLSMYNSMFILGVGSYFASQWMLARGWQKYTMAFLAAGLVIFAIAAAVDIYYWNVVYSGGGTPQPRLSKLITRGGYGVAAGFLVTGAALSGWQARAWLGMALRKIGDASFSIYVTHELVLGIYVRQFGRAADYDATTGIGYYVLAVGLCLGIGTLMHQFVEKPVLALVRGRRKIRG